MLSYFMLLIPSKSLYLEYMYDSSSFSTDMYVINLNNKEKKGQQHYRISTLSFTYSTKNDTDDRYQ